MVLIKRWENHINIYATFVVWKTIPGMAVLYEFYRRYKYRKGMYDLILHLA